MTSRTIRLALGMAALALAAALPATAQSVETRGVVQRVDTAAGIVYFTDGRSVRLEPGSRLTVDGRVVTLADIQPGWTLVVPGVAAAPSPNVVVAAPAPLPARTPRTPVDVTGVVSRVDPATGTIVLEDGRILQTSGRTTIWQPVGVAELKPGASIYMRNADPVDFRPAGSPPAGSARFQDSTKASFAGGRTIGQIIDDAAIVAEVKTKLTAEKLSNLTKIDVKSDAGVVTLGGTVDSAERRARAVQIASSVNGVKTVLNNIEVSGTGSAASTPATGSTASTPAPTTMPPPAPSTVEVTGTVASADSATGTITLQDGRVLKATDQTVVWQPSSVGALRPGAQVLVRGAMPAGNQAGVSTGARHWRMATVSRVDRSANELVLSDGTTVKITSATNVHRGADRLGVEQLEPGSEVVVYTPSASATEATEVAVVWTPTASVR